MELTVDLRWALVIADQLSDPPEVEDIPALEAAIARHASKNQPDADNAWRAATLGRPWPSYGRSPAATRR